MKVGERIYSPVSGNTYTVLHALKAGGQSEIGVVSSANSSKRFILKRLLNIRYSSRDPFQEKCIQFENNRRKIYTKLNSKTLPGGACSYVYDFFHDTNFYYVVTEKIDGFELDTAVLNASLPIEEILYLFRIIIGSFLPFESNGIVHSDIKPDNIFVEIVDGHPIAKILDFESAFFADSPPEKGYVIGTEPYYSPELAAYNSEQEVDNCFPITPKSDIFSLGIILLEMLLGEYPIKGKGLYVYEAVTIGTKISLPKFLSEELVNLIVSMLDVNPANRPGIMEILDVIKKVSDVSFHNDIPAPPIIKTNRYEKSAMVSIFNLNRNYSVSYSLNGSDPKEYNGPFEIFDDDVMLRVTLFAQKGQKFDFTDVVSVSKRRYTMCKRPKILIKAGKVSISCDTVGASIFYTLNGASPFSDGELYVTPFNVPENVVISAAAKKVGHLPSEVARRNSSSKTKLS